MYLDKIQTPQDLKRVSEENLSDVCSEVRAVILQKLSRYGGHIGPNLGMVEATVAMHYVFDSPMDKIVFDVSHQCYAHKILTGRKEAFESGQLSGYTDPAESPHDFFSVGHTSTSVSLACGLAKARDLKQETGNVIAVIGDGSLSGGEAFEGLNNVAEQGTNMIVVVNDNQMSIAENHGGMYRNLQALRQTNGQAACNYFKALGLDYLYVADGNDVAALLAAFRRVKNTPSPIVVHINTLKGKGYKYAEQQKERFHWGFPFDLETGNSSVDFGDSEDYNDITAKYLLAKMQQDPKVVAITSGTPAVMGFTPARREQAGGQFVDVGIAEEHAVALASGIATAGGRPIYGVYGTFLQRTYDQLSQDLCMNNNPAVLLVFACGAYGLNDKTHLGFFDIPLVSNIPNMVYLAPTSKQEYLAMMEWAIEQRTHPVAIRVPGNGVVESSRSVDTHYDQLNRYKVEQVGSRVALIAAGSFYQLGEEVAAELAQQGVTPTLINPRYLTGLDEALLASLRQNHACVVVLEDGVLDGGFGEKIARYYAPTDMKVLCRGLKKEFADRFSLPALLQANGLTCDQLVKDILTSLR